MAKFTIDKVNQLTEALIQKGSINKDMASSLTYLIHTASEYVERITDDLIPSLEVALESTTEVDVEDILFEIKFLLQELAQQTEEFRSSLDR